jgi:hypothetical protein
VKEAASSGGIDVRKPRIVNDHVGEPHVLERALPREIDLVGSGVVPCPA